MFPFFYSNLLNTSNIIFKELPTKYCKKNEQKMYIFQRKNFLDLVEGVSAENSYFSYGKQPNVT